MEKLNIKVRPFQIGWMLVSIVDEFKDQLLPIKDFGNFAGLEFATYSNRVNHIWGYRYE